MPEYVRRCVHTARTGAVTCTLARDVPRPRCRLHTVSLHNFKSQNFKLSVSNPKNKYVAYVSVLSQIANCQGLGRKNKHDIFKLTARLPFRTTETEAAQAPKSHEVGIGRFGGSTPSQLSFLQGRISPEQKEVRRFFDLGFGQSHLAFARGAGQGRAGKARQRPTGRVGQVSKAPKGNGIGAAGS